MSESEQAGPDAVQEAIARAELPLAYRGTVEGEDVRVLGYVGSESPVLEAQVVWYEDPDGNPVPDARYRVPVSSGAELLDALTDFVQSYDLEAEEQGGEEDV